MEDVMRLESKLRKAGSGSGDERFGRVDADDRLGPTDLAQQFGGEGWTAAKVKGHLQR